MWLEWPPPTTASFRLVIMIHPDYWVLRATESSCPNSPADLSCPHRPPAQRRNSYLWQSVNKENLSQCVVLLVCFMSSVVASGMVFYESFASPKVASPTSQHANGSNPWRTNFSSSPWVVRSEIRSGAQKSDRHDYGQFACGVGLVSSLLGEEFRMYQGNCTIYSITLYHFDLPA